MSFQEYSDSFRSKFRIGELNPKIALGLVVIAVVAIAFSVYMAFSSNQAYSENAEEIEIVHAEDEGSESTIESSNYIYVHVAGCVKSPGVYELLSGARANDAIEAAGGFTKGADKSAINLAGALEDAQQIIVPKKSASSSQTATGGNDSEAVSGSSTGDSKGLVNINTASSSELQSLSGIGEAKASKIIEYREKNGSFKSVDDLTNVSGIGEKTLESLRSSICV